MHDPVPQTGAWLRSVVQGCFNYYAVPGNLEFEDLAPPAGRGRDELSTNPERGHLSEGRLAIGEIAFLLGLSEPSAFHRAFKQWTGHAPLTYPELSRTGSCSALEIGNDQSAGATRFSGSLLVYGQTFPYAFYGRIADKPGVK